MDDYISCRISDIPCLQINPTAEPKGTILLYHGWASNIENYLFFGSLISHWGYQVIVPELPYHGERGKLDYFDTEVLQKFFWKVVLQGVKEAEQITSELAKTARNIGMIGHSCGGFIAAGAFSKASQVLGAIVINGSCAWVKFEELYREKDGRQPLDTSEKLHLQHHDPISLLDFQDKRALLVLHGKEDRTVPIDSQRYFMEVNSNIPGEYLQFVEYSGVNHHITLGMLQKSKEWLDQRFNSSTT